MYVHNGGASLGTDSNHGCLKLPSRRVKTWSHGSKEQIYGFSEKKVCPEVMLCDNVLVLNRALADTEDSVENVQ